MKVFSLRLNDSIYEKLQQIAKKQERSLNKQIEYLIKEYISDYEKFNGKIEIDDENEAYKMS